MWGQIEEEVNSGIFSNVMSLGEIGQKVKGEE